MLKSPLFIVTNVIFHVVFMGVLGGNLAQNMAGHLPFNFMQFVLVGMVVNGCFMATVGGMSSLVEERDQYVERLIADVCKPRI